MGAVSGSTNPRPGQGHLLLHSSGRPPLKQRAFHCLGNPAWPAPITRDRYGWTDRKERRSAHLDGTPLHYPLKGPMRLTIAVVIAASISLYAWFSTHRRVPPPPVMAMMQSGGGQIQATMVGHEFRQDDLPSIAASPDGSLWIAGSASSAIVTTSSSATTRKASGAICSGCPTPAAIPGCRRSAWTRRIAHGWSGRSRSTATGTSTRAASIPAKQEWGRSSGSRRDPLPDINPRLTSDGKGKFALVWQGFRGKNSNIFLKTFDGEKWSADMRVTNRAANDWEPAVALDQQGDGLGGLRQLQERQLRCLPRRGERRQSPAGDARSPTRRAWKRGPPLAVDTGGPRLGRLGRGRRRTGARTTATGSARRSAGVPLGGERGLRVRCHGRRRVAGARVVHRRSVRRATAISREIFSDGRGSVWVSAIRTVTGRGQGANAASGECCALRILGLASRRQHLVEGMGAAARQGPLQHAHERRRREGRQALDRPGPPTIAPWATRIGRCGSRSTPACCPTSTGYRSRLSRRRRRRRHRSEARPRQRSRRRQSHPRLHAHGRRQAACTSCAATSIATPS